MLFYSKVGKLALRERLLDKIPWRGDESVLDVGCGRGLLAVGAAKRVSSGTVTGVDVW
ncbi:MAG: 50S ribosomal protein L11 methyltransferase, partial [Acidobacteria bacterium Pan2503]|nr:50S ribosomal protein L11 methyltransferase [Candidatus Acidoferrum panamensis]